MTAGTDSDESLVEALTESGLRADVSDLWSLDKLVLNQAKESEAKYDYVVMAGALERSLNPENTLRIVRCLLSESGKLLLGTDNRLGIRYFCGDRDAFTDRNFDSIENYVRINMSDRQQLEGRAYARAELVQISAGRRTGGAYFSTVSLSGYGFFGGGTAIYILGSKWSFSCHGKQLSDRMSIRWQLFQYQAGDGIYGTWEEQRHVYYDS